MKELVETMQPGEMAGGMSGSGGAGAHLAAARAVEVRAAADRLRRASAQVRWHGPASVAMRASADETQASLLTTAELLDRLAGALTRHADAAADQRQLTLAAIRVAAEAAVEGALTAQRVSEAALDGVRSASRQLG